MSNVTTSIDALAEALGNELTMYSKSVMDGIKKQAKTSAAKLVRQTKATAPTGKSKKHFKDCISYKLGKETTTSISYVWYVKAPKYRLAHLLENGHALRQGGRAKGTHFIKNASEPILEEFVEKCKEICENGG